jgi:hypothetical protein
MTDDALGARITAKLEALYGELGPRTSDDTLVRVALAREGFFTPEELRVLRVTGAQELVEAILREHKA